MRSDVIWKQLKVIISTNLEQTVDVLIINSQKISGDALANTLVFFII